jgi:hypothetical protein
MTDFASLLVPDRGQKSRPIHVVDKDSLASWLKKRPAEDRALIDAQRFDGKSADAFVILPRGGDFEVVSAARNALQRLPRSFPREATASFMESLERLHSAGSSPSTGSSSTARRRTRACAGRASSSLEKRRGSSR